MTQPCPISSPVSTSSTALLLLAALASTLGLAAPAHAATIVTDGGFESAGAGTVYFAGSSIDGGSWNVTKGAVYIDTLDSYNYDGANSLNLTYANDYASNAVSQTLATIAGRTYTISFFADADTPNTFALTENGLAVFGSPTSILANFFADPVSNSSSFTSYTGQFVATSATTILGLAATGSPAIGSPYGSVVVDDVSVQAVPTPEPGSIALVLTGMAGIGSAVRRRFRPAR